MKSGIVSWRWVLSVAAVAVVMTVLLRVGYLAAHYPCDVIAAAMLGTFWTHVCIRFFGRDLQCTPQRSTASCRKLTQR